MFNAIANFFFGGEKTPSEKVEESVEYSTKEAEDADWLLVDVSDHEETDESVANKENDIPDEDDYLSSLPYLLGLETPMSVSMEQPLEVVYCPDRLLLTPSSCLVSKITEQSFTEVLPTERFVAKPTLGRACKSSVFTSLLENFVNVELKLTGDSMLIKSALPRTEKKLLTLCTRRGSRRKSIQASSCKSKSEKQDKHQSHPAELIGPFVNHQPSPVLLSKNDHLQQIKELKPSQLAKEYEIKKRQNRNQLSRLNKVYLYESCNKNQHRRDLWCRHSGANNNRKCC